MRNVIFALGFLVLLVFAGGVVAEEHADDEMGLYSPDKIQWKEGPKSLPPGAKLAVLEGDPSKEGPFVMRLRFPDRYSIPAHTHPKTERVTVLSGTLFIVMGEPLDKKRARSMPAGSYGYWPAGMKHLGWAEGETVIQLHGIGPWSIKYLNPADDPRNK
jgi:quercetin dioxygenase-like cupin family protein